MRQKVFLQIPLHLFNGQNVSTDEVEDRELSDLSCRITDTPDNDQCIRLIEQFFFRRLASGSEYNLKRLSTVLDEINLHPQVNTLQLSDVACLSTKQFGRVFTDYIGTTPKRFSSHRAYAACLVRPATESRFTFRASGL